MNAALAAIRRCGSRHPKDWLRARCEFNRELWPLIQELRLPELVPYPLPRGPVFLDGSGIRVTSSPSKLPAEGGERRSRQTG
jgi:hypothetical protein